MPDDPTSTIIQDGPRNHVVHLTNVSDGTGETLVTKVDASGLSGSPTRLSIQQIWYTTSGMAVDLFFVGSADTLALSLPENQTDHFDYRSISGLQPTGASPTGDIKLTTRGHTNLDTYAITLSLKKA